MPWRCCGLSSTSIRPRAARRLWHAGLARISGGGGGRGLWGGAAEVARLKASLATLEPAVACEEIVEVPPVTLIGVPGFETAAFPYTTDIPFLDRWGQPLLLGPGAILVAHTDQEHVRVADLHRAVDQY